MTNVLHVMPRFEAKFEKTEGCWLWTASKFPKGYGQFKYLHDGKPQQYAHRISAHLYKGFDFNPDVVVCHKCDNPSCVNPDHLFLGTTSDNMRDMSEKGRSPKWNKRFSERDMELAMFLREEGATLSQIQGVLDCDLSTASLLSRGLVVKKINKVRHYVPYEW